MKNKFPFLIFFICLSFHLSAQDTIVLNSGQKIAARKVRILSKIFYKNSGGFQSGYDSIEKTKVNYILYPSGRIERMIPLPWSFPFTVSSGIGISSIQYKFKDPISDTGAGIISTSPVYNFTIEYATSQKFSIGISVSWQSLKINPYVSFHDSLHYDSTSMNYFYSYHPFYPYGNAQYSSLNSIPRTGGANTMVVETLTRLNIGLRLVYHQRNDNVMDFYYGARIGLSLWTDQSNPSGFVTEGNKIKPSIQAFIGLRREITNVLGIFIEGGVGTPYFAQLGICAKFNTKKI